jgi:hypothetical protein
LRSIGALVLAIAGIVATACATSEPAIPDLSVLGTVRAPFLSEVGSAISRDAALAEASRHAFWSATPSAYLVVVTSPNTDLDNSLVWVVRYTGIHWEKPGPPLATGERSVTLYDKAYVIVDGKAPNFLFTIYSE